MRDKMFEWLVNWITFAALVITCLVLLAFLLAPVVLVVIALIEL